MHDVKSSRFGIFKRFNMHYLIVGNYPVTSNQKQHYIVGNYSVMSNQKQHYIVDNYSVMSYQK